MHATAYRIQLPMLCHCGLAGCYPPSRFQHRFIVLPRMALLNGVAIPMTIRAIADAAIGREALTLVIAWPAVLLQATFNVLMLALVAAGTVIV